MQKAYEKIRTSSSVAAGSSTACFGTLREAHLEVANLGDSGFSIVRPSLDNPLVFASPPLTVGFNFPYQLSKNPEAHYASQANHYSMELQHGDIILLYSDGLCDNLFEQDVAKFYKQALDKGYSLEEATKGVMREAILVAYSQKKEKVKTPFEVDANKHGYKWDGGKLDDITILALQVFKNQTSKL